MQTPNLVQLDRNAHQALRIQENQVLQPFRNATMCAVIVDEIARLVVEFPVVIAKNGETGKYLCAALFGADPAENLMWRDERWTSYSLPLNLACQPFYVVNANSTDPAGESRLVTCVDMDNPGVQSNAGEALFDSTGNQTPYLAHKLARLSEVVGGEARTREFIETLEGLQLIRAITFEYRAPGSEPRKIGGLFSVDETRLAALEPAHFASLSARGFLHPIYAMLSSLGHLQIFAARSTRLRELAQPA